MAETTTQDTGAEWGDTPGFWPRLLQGRPRWVVVTVVAALVAALTVGGFGLWSALAGPQAEAGEFLRDSTAVGLADSATVKLPWGDLEVSAGRPTAHIPDTVLFSDEHDATLDEIDAPDDGSWIALKIEPVASFDSPLFRSSANATIPATTVSVMSGGRTIPVARAAGGGTQSTAQVVASQLAPAVKGYLALPDRPEDLQLRVEFAGERQDVHLYSGKIEAGRSASLYRETKDIGASCSTPVVPGYRPGYGADRGCAMNRLATVPYVAGLGWAEKGRSWLVTTVYSAAPPQWFRTGVANSRGRYYLEDFGSGTSQLRYGNALPRTQARFNDVKSSVFQDVENPNQYVFDVPSSDTGRGVFTVTTRFLVRLADDGDPRLPAQVELAATRTIRP